MSRCARVDAIWLMTCSLAGGAVVVVVAFEMTKGKSRLCVEPASQVAVNSVSGCVLCVREREMQCPGGVGGSVKFL